LGLVTFKAGLQRLTIGLPCSIDQLYLYRIGCPLLLDDATELPICLRIDRYALYMALGQRFQINRTEDPSEHPKIAFALGRIDRLIGRMFRNSYFQQVFALII